MILAYAVCSVSVMPLRAEDSHRSEQVSQVLFGERLEILDRNHGWLKVRCEWDEYEGWASEGQVAVLNYKEYRKPLHSFSCGATDTIQVPQGRFPLSPGSSLFMLRRNAIQWGYAAFHFKGKKISLSRVTAGEDQVHAYSHLFLGAPYQWGGRCLMGIDCSGLTQMVYKMMNMRIPRDAAEQAVMGDTVDFLQEARCGDLAFFDNAEGRINHVGILLNDHTIIHATETSGCVVVDAIDNGGIISRKLRKRTHSLRLVKRILP